MAGVLKRTICHDGRCPFHLFTLFYRRCPSLSSARTVILVCHITTEVIYLGGTYLFILFSIISNSDQSVINRSYT